VALYYTVEENVQGAFIPRLIAAGADRRRVKVVAAVPSADGNGSSGLRLLPEGIGDMRRAILHHCATMVVLDPISDYFQANTDTNSEVAVRSALKPLARLAEDLNIAIICVRHLNKKSGDQALYRMLGSSAFIQMPRAILKVEHDPEIEHGRVLSCIKGNYVIKPLARRFKLTSGRKGIVRIEWGAALDSRRNSKTRPTS
jgi:AAA domain